MPFSTSEYYLTFYKLNPNLLVYQWLVKSQASTVAWYTSWIFVNSQQRNSHALYFAEFLIPLHSPVSKLLKTIEFKVCGKQLTWKRPSTGVRSSFPHETFNFLTAMSSERALPIAKQNNFLWTHQARIFLKMQSNMYSQCDLRSLENQSQRNQWYSSVTSTCHQ